MRLEVVTVVDSLSVTSMPVNEFVIYRSIHNYNIEQVLIVINGDKPRDLIIPKNIKLFFVNNSLIKIKSIVKKLETNAKKNNTKVVYHLHNPKSALIFFIAAFSLKIRNRTLFTIHSTYVDRDIKYKLVSCLCALLAKFVNTVGKSAYNGYPSFIKYIKGKHFITVQNGVDIERIDKIINCSNKKKDISTLICVGRMIPLKNHSFLIRVLSNLPEYKLILVGKEDNENRVRELARNLKVIDRVEFCGLIPREKVFEKLAMSRLYLSSSIVEGLPVSVLEAMRVGLVPILSDIEPHKEIKEKCSEIEVLPLNEKLWVEKIKNISDLENKSKVIKEKVKEKFSLENMHEKYLEIYQKLVSNVKDLTNKC